MKVADLIKQLKELDPNMAVVVPDGEGYYEPATFYIKKLGKLYESSIFHYKDNIDVEVVVFISNWD